MAYDEALAKRVRETLRGERGVTDSLSCNPKDVLPEWSVLLTAHVGGASATSRRQ